MKKKYFLFSGNDRTTGFDGFRGSFTTVDDALQYLFENYDDYNFAQVVDIEHLKVVWVDRN